MAPSYFPLRWESTCDQWWFASPIDWAAANGHYDLVRELVHIDPNLLIKLTSLRRIRRLEMVWDDDARFADVARCRSSVARRLLLGCDTRDGNNTLIRAGYGGWLLYTAASAGDMGFIQELLQRHPLLVFGEGEFGVTDMLYAAARSKNSEAFRILFDFAVNPRCLAGTFEERRNGDDALVFRREMLNRAVHAAARGGHLEILQRLLSDSHDVLVYRDAQGSTILHAASARGQVEVVKNLIASYHMIDSRDNQGNTSLHVAAFRGHLAVVEALVVASPSSVALKNKMGDTFLHLAVAGFTTPGFRRLDRQMELMKWLVSGNVANIEEIINSRNNDGRTALHMAVIGNVQCNLVCLLMTIGSVELNIRDVDGMTPLDLICRRPRSASSEKLIKRLISAGGISNSRDYIRRTGIASHLKMQGISSSPGTSFNISDAEIFLYTGIEVSGVCADRRSGRRSSCSSISKSDITPLEMTEITSSSVERKKHTSVGNAAAKRLKTLLRQLRKKDKKINHSSKMLGNKDSVGSHGKCSQQDDTPTPTALQQQVSKPTPVQNHKRVLGVGSSIPSPSTKRRFAEGLMHGVIQAMPHLAASCKSQLSSPQLRCMSPPKQKDFEIDPVEPSLATSSATDGSNTGGASQKPGGGLENAKSMNQYFCFGTQELAQIPGDEQKLFFKHTLPIHCLAGSPIVR